MSGPATPGTLPTTRDEHAGRDVDDAAVDAG
jgi:hypothetical protein